MIQYFQNYIETTSILGIIYDCLSITMLAVLLYLLTKQSTKSKTKVMLIIIFTILYVGALVTGAKIANALYEPITLYWPVAIIVLFNDEIIEVSRKFEFRHKKRSNKNDLSYVVKSLSTSIETLSKNRVGALFVIEASQKLDILIKNAILIDASISEELIQTIFNTSTPLHDGAVVVRDGRIVCAGVYFQPSSNENISKELGSRHRAAIGASELYDSLIIVVSEETGKISIARDGKLDRNIKKDDLIKYLEEYI